MDGEQATAPASQSGPLGRRPDTRSIVVVRVIDNGAAVRDIEISKPRRIKSPFAHAYYP
jgi:hypothetical protein